MTKKYIPNLNTFADIVDRLIVEVNKLAYFENKKREEHSKDNPDTELIVYWDNLSRDCCEFRSMLKSAMNVVLSDIVESREYQTLSDVRTFSKPKKTVAEVIVDRCYWAGSEDFKKDLIKALKDEL